MELLELAAVVLEERAVREGDRELGARELERLRRPRVVLVEHAEVGVVVEERLGGPDELLGRDAGEGEVGEGEGEEPVMRAERKRSRESCRPDCISACVALASYNTFI